MHKIPPGVAADLSILLLLDRKPWETQDMKIWLQQLKDVAYYIWTLGYTTTPD